MATTTKRRRVDLTTLSIDEIVDQSLSGDIVIPGAPVGWISTGSDLLDWSTGGGLPMGRMTELYGMESSGKSLIAISAAKQVLRHGGRVIYLDCEPGIDTEWLKMLGINPDHITLRTPSWLEEVHDIIENVVKARKGAEEPTLIVWDSIAATAARAAFEKKSAEDTVALGLEARLNGDFFRRSALKNMSRSRIALLVINQLREKLATRFSYGEESTESTPGGKSTRFYSSLRIKVKRSGWMKRDDSNPYGAFIKSEVTKNKVGPPKRTAEFPVFFRSGIDNGLSLIRFLEDVGNFFGSTAGRIAWQGKSYFRKDFRRLMLSDENIYREVLEAAKAAYFDPSGANRTDFE